MAASTPDGERGIVIILTAVMALGTCTQFVLGALAPRVSTELGLSAASFGLLVTGLFACGLLIAATAGRVVDRWGTAHALAGVCTSTGIVMVALALVRSDSRWMLVVVGAAGGLAMALANPATNAIVGQRAPGSRQGSAVGWIQAGVQVAALGAGILAAATPWLGGWRKVAWLVATVS